MKRRRPELMLGADLFRAAACLAVLWGLAVFAVPTTTSAAERVRAITRLTYDPDAPKVELFQGMEEGKVDAKVIAKNPQGGFFLLENKTKQPLSVQLPEAVVGVQVLQQFGGMAGGLGGGLGGGAGGQQGGAQAQSFGGGAGGGLGGQQGGLGGGLGAGGGAGQGFFSIPPEKTIRVPYTSVCLNHGKPDPHPRMTYRLVQPESYTEDQRLVELLKFIGTGKVHPQVAQAAAWHLTDKMSWNELANKSISRLGGQGPVPYFSRAELLAARNLVAMATAKAKENPRPEPEPIKSGGVESASTN